MLEFLIISKMKLHTTHSVFHTKKRNRKVRVNVAQTDIQPITHFRFDTKTLCINHFHGCKLATTYPGCLSLHALDSHQGRPSLIKYEHALIKDISFCLWRVPVLNDFETCLIYVLERANSHFEPECCEISFIAGRMPAGYFPLVKQHTVKL